MEQQKEDIYFYLFWSFVKIKGFNEVEINIHCTNNISAVIVKDKIIHVVLSLNFKTINAIMENTATELFQTQCLEICTKYILETQSDI